MQVGGYKNKIRTRITQISRIIESNKIVFVFVSKKYSNSNIEYLNMAHSGEDGEWMEGVVMGLVRYKKGSNNIVEHKFNLNKLLKEESFMVKTGKFLPFHVILFHTQCPKWC